MFHACFILIGSSDLARIFITGCPNWDFKKLGCTKSPIEKVKIIKLIMYINKSSYYMLNFFKECLCYCFEVKLFRNLT